MIEPNTLVAPDRHAGRHPSSTLDELTKQLAEAAAELPGVQVASPSHPILAVPETDEPVTLRLEQLTFTIPLPDQSKLEQNAAALLLRSADLLQDGKVRAARDACYAFLAIQPDYQPVYLRLAEINAVLGVQHEARVQAEALVAALEAGPQQPWLWRVYRLLAYLADDPLPALRQTMDLRLAQREIADAGPYAGYLVRLLSQRGDLDEAMEYSTRFCELEPANTDAALEHTVLLVNAGQANEAIDRWERAAQAGADAVYGRAALAPIMSLVDEAEHWDMVADIATSVRMERDGAPVNAYRRIAAAMEPSPILATGTGVLLAQIDPVTAARVLGGVDGAGGPVTSLIRSVTYAGVLTGQRSLKERANALSDAFDHFEAIDAAHAIPWPALIGWTPTVAQLSSQLAGTLTDLGDPAAAVGLLSRAFQLSAANDVLGVQLADAYIATGTLGAALSVLDQLASALRDKGRIREMATILRKMAQVAPNNVKVKTRIIDAFLQRGFVVEARAEMLHLADLEEKAGNVAAAQESLERAANLGWTIGLQEEAFAIYQRVLAMNPTALEPRHALVTLLLQVGRRSAAIKQQREIVDLADQSNQPHEAIAALHQTIGIAPDDKSTYHRLAESLATVGEYGQAERVYRRLVAIDPTDPSAAGKAESMAALHHQSARQ